LQKLTQFISSPKEPSQLANILTI